MVDDVLAHCFVVMLLLFCHVVAMLSCCHVVSLLSCCCHVVVMLLLYFCGQLPQTTLTVL